MGHVCPYIGVALCSFLYVLVHAQNISTRLLMAMCMRARNLSEADGVTVVYIQRLRGHRGWRLDRGGRGGG